MLLLEDLGTLVIWLVILVILLNILFLFFVFYRRLTRKRYFVEKDAANVRYQPVIDKFAAGELPMETVAQALANAKAPAERDAVEGLLFGSVTPENSDSFSKLVFALGYVQDWASTAFGSSRAKTLIKLSLEGKEQTETRVYRSPLVQPIRKLKLFAIPRALALDSLGKLSPVYAHIFLREGLLDPSTEVRRVVVQNMGRNRYPDAIPLLVQELRRAVEEGNDVSLRTMKTALIAYSLEDFDYFLPYLTHPNQRARFFVVDTMREICARTAKKALLTKNDFSASLYKVMLEKVAVDEFADVRARCTYVIRHFRDDHSLEALRTLLRDDNEFVRLHAVRACEGRFFADLVPDILARTTDMKWRVREAAVKALANIGPQGREEMYKYFITCADGYSCEQIAEEMQRTGMMRDVIARVAAGGDLAVLGMAVCQKMALMGKNSLMLSAMASIPTPATRIGLMEAMAVSPTPEYLELLMLVARSSSGQVQSRAVEILRGVGLDPTYASSAQIVSSARQAQSSSRIASSSRIGSSSRIRSGSNVKPPEKPKDV